ncbi:MFS transporter [uncultured Ornithinimicrobium sp.]|uniref:MFS transporter n=1 Tax=uncultured Ornithinimicrobium sp. TaxID=259307 RepID=UPI0025918CEF|nr:MFS transporter [uncultured Ornithinimicrobium sp.]
MTGPRSSQVPVPDGPAAPASIWSVPGMVALAVVAFTGFSGYAVLLPVAPLWVVEAGSDSAGAGLVNFVLLGSTVATQFAVPPAIGRWGWGRVVGGGLTLLGLPSVLHLLSGDLLYTLLLSAVRGVGFGVLTVAGSAAAVLLVDGARRGAAVGAYSLSLSVPNVLLMPLGGWVSQAAGFAPAFWIGALPLVGVPAAVVLARHLPVRSTHDPRHPEVVGAPAGARTYLALLPPTFVLLAVTLAGGAVITFAPQLVAVPWLGALGLFAMGLATSLTRWRIGGLSDRVPIDRLVWPFVLLAAVSLGGVALLVREPVQVAQVLPWVVATALVGVSYGALQNLTMLQAFAAAGPRRVGAASAVWNAGFDTGTASGALLVGWVAVGAGFGTGMGLTAVICLLTLPLALLGTRRR